MMGYADMLVGSLLAGGLALLAHRYRLLTVGGCAALLVAVVAVWALAGWVYGVPLVVSLLLSGLACRHAWATKALLLGPSSPGAIGALSVLARLAWPMMLAGFTSQGALPRMAAFAGTLAVVWADVWATELGMLSRDRPRLLASGRPAIPGTPGAVSPLGLVAALGASGLNGFLLLLCANAQAAQAGLALSRTVQWLPLASTAGGMTGVLTDSLLGGMAQALYHCEECQTWSETSVHTCGRPATQVRGWAWMTNDAVNSVSGLVGASVALGTIRVLSLL
ncbi:MAG: DUF92 domain-containing protein [Chloroflexi bacterium]|nr:DUF92 domain-containing protein [Chloroflexota bacterium]